MCRLYWFHTSLKFLKKGFKVIGVDNLNDYYDVKLKKNRLDILIKNSSKKKNFNFQKLDLSDHTKLEKIFKKYKFDFVINLAAQAGVRYSLINPRSYLNTNLVGFFNILDCSNRYKIKHLVYASTSSVYGANESFPLKETKIADHPIQFYAATKKSNEIMAHSYSSIYNLPTTGLRFFTVYGPWGRPDMALYFTKNIFKGNKIPFLITEIIAGLLPTLMILWMVYTNQQLKLLKKIKIGLTKNLIHHLATVLLEYLILEIINLKV